MIVLSNDLFIVRHYLNHRHLNLKGGNFTMYDLEEREDIRKKIIEKAWKDPSFKEDLLNNPKAKLKEDEEFKLIIPEGIDLKVYEETDNQFYLIIPQEPCAISPNPTAHNW